MALNQKLVSEFMKIGNLSTKDANAALQVYLELCEEKKYWDVEYKYNNTLKTLYFTARKSKSESTSIFVPRCSCDGLSFNQMQTLFQLCDDCETVFLALVSSDSTCVYYQISNGLHNPQDTNAKHSRLNKREKLDSAIKKHRNVLTEAALCGTLVTIRDRSNQTKQMP